MSLREALDAIVAYHDARADDEALAARLRALRKEQHEAEMLALLGDDRWEARALAAWVLRFIPSARGGRPPLDRERPRAAALAARAEIERDPRVLAALLAALNELHDAAAAATCSRLALEHVAHPETSVRLASVCLLGSSGDPAAVDALIAATDDDDDEVRDWACFELGHAMRDGGLRFDGAAVRDALARRLDDPRDDAREEAATGLLVRGDVRGLAVVERWLDAAEADGLTERVLDAISERPHRRFAERLATLADQQPDHASLREALEACRDAPTD